MKDGRALAIACWFKMPYSTAGELPSTYAARLYEAIPLEHRTSDDEESTPGLVLNGKSVTTDELRIYLRGYFGNGLLF